MSFELENIKEMIYVIRGQKVLLDSDLAQLYGVETKRLNEQVRRNIDRFPSDFMFQLSSEEHLFLKSQFATSKTGRGGKQKQPLVFTENGVAMLSSVLNSKQAIGVNISIMRIFTKLRSFHLLEKDLVNKIEKLEFDVTGIFKIVFERLDRIEKLEDSMAENRQKIGISNKD